MIHTKLILKSIVGFLLLSILFVNIRNTPNTSFTRAETVEVSDTLKSVFVTKNIPIKNYFTYLDSLVKSLNETENFNLTEHLLVRFNPWIIDSLAATDYYKMIEKDSFIYNQKEMIALKKGSKLIVPDSTAVDSLLTIFNTTFLDINIPEYKLRVCMDSIILYDFPVRVGRNEKKYLRMGDRVTDLKTKTGIGTIVNHVKDPDYYNPVTGRQYFSTRRDDDKLTKLPQIPWIETEINGIRNGQLIHPTTNPNTLSKAYSNGCIGTKEGDAWIIYYYAPINTKVVIRYDLRAINKQGDTISFKNIYGFKI
jgi:L,D-transpeptidase ErfK/SrfK